MKRISVFICILLAFICEAVQAQHLTLENGLNRIPYSKTSYKERYLPIGYTDCCIVNIYTGIDGKMYEDLQCRQFTLAKGNIDFTPEVYLKVSLSDELYLGALSFGGCTDYRTDMLFTCDTKGNVKDTLECCVLNGDLAVKQYEVKNSIEIIVYQMIFDSSDLLPCRRYSVNDLVLTGYIQKTTYRISREGKFLKTDEQSTSTKIFPSSSLQKYNLWEPSAFGMSY